MHRKPSRALNWKTKRRQKEVKRTNEPTLVGKMRREKKGGKAGSEEDKKVQKAEELFTAQPRKIFKKPLLSSEVRIRSTKGCSRLGRIAWLFCMWHFNPCSNYLMIKMERKRVGGRAWKDERGGGVAHFGTKREAFSDREKQTESE